MNNYVENKAKSLVNFYATENLALFKQNARELKDKPYGKYLKRDLYIYDDAIREINNGPMPVENALPFTPDGLNKLLEPGYLPGETGYCELPDGTLYSSSLTYFPNCTAEMFQWWFWWHSAESERYKIWFPYAHVSIQVVNRKVLTQPGLTAENRYIGNTHILTEYLENKRNDIAITFVDPSELGMDTSRFAAAGIRASACGIVKLQKPDAIFCMMIHLLRETPNGMELRSRYFIGQNLSIRFFCKYRKLPASIKRKQLAQNGGLQLAYNQVLHDQIEFTNLASFLPELYREFGMCQ